MARRRTFILVSSLALAATACTALIGLDDVPSPPARDAGPVTTGGDSSTVDAGPTTVDLKTGVAAYALAYCTRYHDCSGPDFEFNYRDIDECVGSLAGYPTWSAALPGSTETGALYQQCAANITALSCVQFASHDADFACVPKGTRKVNDRCLSNAQCESGFCGSDNDTCRGCINPPDNGTPCAAGSQCGPGLLCNGSNTCVTQSTSGQSCSTDKPCAYPLACIDSKCSPLPATAGATCSTANGGCDTTKGFICSSNKCVPFAISGPGGPCVYSGAALKICRRSGACGDAGTCGNLPGEGEDCATDNSKPACLSPLRCLQGKCVGLPASSTCE